MASGSNASILVPNNDTTNSSANNASYSESTDMAVDKEHTETSYSQLISSMVITSSKPKATELINYKIPTSNKFDALRRDLDNKEQIDDEDDPEPQFSQNDTTQNTTTQNTINPKEPETNKKYSKPPPIVIHHKINSKDFVQLLKLDIKKGFEIKYTRNNTNVFINDHKEYKTYLLKLKGNQPDNLEFHTYATKEEKTHAFVLKGLDQTTDLEYLKENLGNQDKINVKNIFAMKNRKGLFLVVTDNSITEKYLNRNLRVVCHTRVTWERQVQTNQIIQCRKCQQWGHATSNCFAKEKCLKCSLDHWSRECPLVKKEDIATHANIKCPNCQGKHLAFSKDCAVYLRRLELISKSKTRRAETFNPKPQFIPAPIPKNNPWTRTYNNQQSHHTRTTLTNIHPTYQP